MERVLSQRADLRVGRNHRHAAVSVRPPARYEALNIFISPAPFLCSWPRAVIVGSSSGHSLKQVMWFRVSAEARREFAHHTDPNQISPSYRGRTR